MAADEEREGRELSDHPEAVRARERRKGGDGGGAKRKRRGSPSESDIRNRLREALGELASVFERRDPELSRVLHRDGPKMADLLAKWGEHPKAPAGLKVAVVVLAELLEPLRAFGGTTRLLLRRLGEARAARARDDYGDDALNNGDQPQPWSEPPEPPFVGPAEAVRETPSRFRFDETPPDVD